MNAQLIKEIDVFAEKIHGLKEDTVWEFCNGKILHLISSGCNDSKSVIFVSRDSTKIYIRKSLVWTHALRKENIIVVLLWGMCYNHENLGIADAFVLEHVKYFNISISKALYHMGALLILNPNNQNRMKNLIKYPK